MDRRLLIRLLLGLSLLAGGRPSCQTTVDPSPKPESPSMPSAINPCEPEAQECKDQIMARERFKELALRSQQLEERIVIQKLKKIGKNRYAPGAVNFYRGEVTFGKKTRFRKIFEKVNWKSSFWRFYLPGFAEMCFLDPDHFDGLNYDLDFSGDETLLGRRCRVYRVKPKKPAKGWRFQGTIWVLPDDLAIVRADGAFQPMRKIRLFFLVEDYRFSFDSWRKEISAGNWVPDYTCTGTDVAKSDFTNPAFRARITFNGKKDNPSARSETACGIGLSQFPPQAAQPK